MNDNLELIKRIVDKSLTFNKDINQHIESCRISIDIINQKDEIIKILRNTLAKKYEENLELRKEKFIIEGRKDIEVKELKEVLIEQYKLMEDLISKK